MFLFRRKRRFPKWAALLSLAIIGMVAATFISAIFFLYWLKAPVALPDPARLVAPGADFFLVCRPDLSREAVRSWLAYLLQKALSGAPGAARAAARYALKPDCPLQLVVSGRTPEGGPQKWVATISLGRYRGAFWMADRSLRGKARKGLIPYALRQWDGHTFYEQTRSGRSDLNVLAVWKATGLAGSDMSAVGRVYDALGLKSFHSKLTIPKLGEWVGRGRLIRPKRAAPFLVAMAFGQTPDLDKLLEPLGQVDVRLRVDEEERLVIEAEAKPREKGAALVRVRKTLASIVGRLVKEGLVAEGEAKLVAGKLRFRALIKKPEEPKAPTKAS